MKALIAISAALVFLVSANLVVAADPADPTGTWMWRYPNQSAEHTLKLKLEGDKLTGSIKNYQNDRESQIEEAVYKEGVVSFKHTYKRRDSQTIVASYSGTLKGDMIEGTIEINHPERKLMNQWYASRMK